VGACPYVQSTLYAALTYLHGSADLAARGATIGDQYGTDERARQSEDLALLQDQGGVLDFNPLGPSEDEAAAARSLIGTLRTGR
jgi:hypothetical protein